MDRTLTKEELEEMYSTLSQAEICKKLDIHVMALYQLLDEAKIPRKKPWNKRTKWKLVG